jgi:hypothetical protein
MITQAFLNIFYIFIENQHLEKDVGHVTRWKRINNTVKPV